VGRLCFSLVTEVARVGHGEPDPACLASSRARGNLRLPRLAGLRCGEPGGGCAQRAGIQCWIAPRDIAPGENYTQAILEALARAPAVVLVFSAATNVSPHVQRELETAVGAGTRIIPVRLAAVEPSPSLRYFIGTAQWLDIAGVPSSRWEPLLVDAARRALAAPPSQRSARTVAASQTEPAPRVLTLVRVLAIVVLVAVAVAVAVVVKLMGNGDGSGQEAVSDTTSSSAESTNPSSPATPTTSTPPTQEPSPSPIVSPVTGTVVLEERFDGGTAFPLGTYDSNGGSMVSSLRAGALRISVTNTSQGWDSWVSVDTPRDLVEWTVTASATSARADGWCGVMASDGSTVITADLEAFGGSARISIYRNETVLAQQSFAARGATGAISITRGDGLLVMRAGDVVVGSLPPQRLGPIRQGGVVGVGDTNDCDFDEFKILTPAEGR
jgi:hypothetical protein